MFLIAIANKLREVYTQILSDEVDKTRRDQGLYWFDKFLTNTTRIDGINKRIEEYLVENFYGKARDGIINKNIRYSLDYQGHAMLAIAYFDLMKDNLSNKYVLYKISDMFIMNDKNPIYKWFNSTNPSHRSFDLWLLQRLLFVSLVIASKTYNDKSMGDKYYTQVIGFESIKELNLIMLKTLIALDFVTTFVSPQNQQKLIMAQDYLTINKDELIPYANIHVEVPIILPSNTDNSICHKLSQLIAYCFTNNKTHALEERTIYKQSNRKKKSQRAGPI